MGDIQPYHSLDAGIDCLRWRGDRNASSHSYTSTHGYPIAGGNCDGSPRIYSYTNFHPGTNSYSNTHTDFHASSDRHTCPYRHRKGCSDSRT